MVGSLQLRYSTAPGTFHVLLHDRSFVSTPQAVITIRTTSGERRDIYLGTFNSPESRAEYGRIIAESASTLIATAHTPTTPALTVDTIALAYVKWASGHYRSADGHPSGEVLEINRAIRFAHHLYGHVPASEFGPRALAAP